MRRAIATLVLALVAAACTDLGERGIVEPVVTRPIPAYNKSLLTTPGRLAGPVYEPSGHAPGTTVAGMPPGNAFYSVYVAPLASAQFAGAFTVGTGPDHPVTLATGESQNVLYGGAYGDPGTTYTTIRSYGSGTDYVQGADGSGSDFVVVGLGSYATAVDPIIGGTGFTTTYVIDGRDRLTVQQTVRANGTAFSNSSVEVTTAVTNDGTQAVAIGIRYLWDFEIGADDGPAFYGRDPDFGPIVTEADYSPPAFGFYKVEDNDRNDPTPLFAVYGTNTGPAGLQPAPSGASRIAHAQWRSAYFFHAFDYPVDPALIVSTTAAPWRGSAGGDNAVLTFAGHNAANAIIIEPGATFIFSHSIFSAPADGTPPPFEPPDDDEPGDDPPDNGGAGCTRTIGYWRNHAENWPLAELVLGGQDYSAAAALAVLRTPPRGDATIIAGAQLIAAKLNIAAGADGTPVLAAIEALDTWLASVGGIGANVGTAVAGAALELAALLDAYNKGLAGPLHCP